MRVLFPLLSIALSLATVAPAAAATTYPAITINVPVAISLPLPAAQQPTTSWGNSQLEVACASGTSVGSGFTTIPVVFTNNTISYTGPPIAVSMKAGLQTGNVVTCTITFIAGTPVNQTWFNGLNASSNAAQVILP